MQNEKERKEEDTFLACVSWFQQSLSFDAFAACWLFHATGSPWDVDQRQRLIESVAFSGECNPRIEDILAAGFCYCAPHLAHGKQNMLEGAFQIDPYFFLHKTDNTVHFSFCFRRMLEEKDNDLVELMVYSHLYLETLYEVAKVIVEKDFHPAMVIALECVDAHSFRITPKIQVWKIPFKAFLNRYLEKLKVEEGAVFRPK